jgi:ABC-2 type transport system ATP-binding protein
MERKPMPSSGPVKQDLADERPSVVRVEHVSMSFNMASEQLHSLKEYFIKLVRRELFFKEFIALNDISLTVRKGDVYGIVGTNGSGKSTLLKIVAGVLEPTKGSCEVCGNIAPLIELGAGFDFELTARENIYLNGALLGYSKAFINERFDEIVAFAELRDFLELPMKNYSSGMVARIAFAIATITIPDILIVDETLSVGDMFFREKCEKKIQSLIDEHKTTVLFVSHSIDEVERICRRAVWIDKGRLMMDGTTDEVCAAYKGSEH